MPRLVRRAPIYRTVRPPASICGRRTASIPPPLTRASFGSATSLHVGAWKRSAAGQGVNLRAGRRRRLRRPGLAGIETRVDLAAVGGARDAARLPVVEGQTEHRVRHLDAHLYPGPAVAGIAAVQHHPDLTLEATTCCHPYMTWVAGHLADVTAVDVSLWVKRDVA